MMKKNEYLAHVKDVHPKSNHFSTMLKAFLVGGLICMLGQGFQDLFTMAFPQWEPKDIAALTSVTLIFIGSTLTAIGVYDKIGKFAGAGSVIPITGFANSVTAPALEFRREGIIFGVMAKMFTVAGPVLVSGVSASALVAFIYRMIYLFG